MPHTKNQDSNQHWRKVLRAFCQLLKRLNRTVINICCCFLIICAAKSTITKLFILPNKVSSIPFAAAANLIYLLFIFILLERAQHNNKTTSVKNSSKNFLKKKHVGTNCALIMCSSPLSQRESCHHFYSRNISCEFMR